MCPALAKTVPYIWLAQSGLMLKSQNMVAKRILLVEDQKDSANVLRAGLENLSADFEVVEVSSAEDALRSLEQGAFDLLVADVMLPGISGLELMAHFRYYNPETKVILISGVPDPEIRKSVARAGAEAFFFKPLDLADFLDAVERLFGMVESGLPSEMDSLRSQLLNGDEDSQRISEHIADLRRRLGALSVSLINERGQIVARAGALPDEAIETTLMPDLMVAFFASLRVAVFTDSQQPDDLLCYRTPNYHLYLTSIGPSFSLLIATKPHKSNQLSTLADESSRAVARLSPLLARVEHAFNLEAMPAPKQPRKKNSIE
ncbi:MAG: response regulator, partial [Chloroflexi bacterium]|nr:response regulator [Chloroflexota bacterium]